ncbi:hypothetical protein CLPU_11c00770 [Gottschalkia purinilytica]|uniref:Uncharacterized protein n=1 Tax=Gottschalkia purinilytica TaxID=1503 RepID=A0A0L0W8L4_GOTPU|nr:hypothetical protein [Gottschalkia purinilytica]KNF07908.1 hypothetical protein CLPU_11c00770 [Gottschalkia purinilytica]
MNSILNQFVKYIELDEEKRILISLQNHFESYLQDKNTKAMIKEVCQSILKDDFVQLEIGKNICRVTVKEGTEEKNVEIVKNELLKNFQMAMSFLSQMKNNKK